MSAGLKAAYFSVFVGTALAIARQFRRLLPDRRRELSRGSRRVVQLIRMRVDSLSAKAEMIMFPKLPSPQIF